MNKHTYDHRASSTAALTRGRMLSSKKDIAKPLPSNQIIVQAPFIWVTFF
jgi:hypothetical protein